VWGYTTFEEHTPAIDCPITPAIPLEIGGNSRFIIKDRSLQGAEIKEACTDGTIDEFYLWKIYAGLDDHKQIRDEYIKSTLWGRGRYYNGNDVEFVSGEIEFEKLILQSPSLAGVTFEVSKPTPLILGIQWTSFAELYNYDELLYMGGDIDWAPPRRDIFTEIFLEAWEGGSWQYINRLETVEWREKGKKYSYTYILPMKKAGWQWVHRDLKEPPYKLRWSVRFQITDASASPVLIESPIFDDLTIYYRAGVSFLSWILV
jgi:hypothetical protein